MHIDHLKHGDEALWLAIGPFATHRDTLDELGGPIYSGPDTQWLVAYERDAVVGFVAWRPTKSGVYYDYAYVVEASRDRGIFAKLAARRDELAAVFGLPTHAMVRKPRVKHYRQRGWKAKSERGQWSHLVREAGQ